MSKELTNNENTDVEVLEKNEIARMEETEMDKLRLRKEYIFEGKTYQEIDLSGFHNITAKDMIDVNHMMERTGSFSFNPEMTVEYACIMAANITGLPHEFFYGLSPKDILSLKGRVTSFFYGTD